MGNDKLPQMVGEWKSLEVGTAIRSEPELPYLVNAACDILIASGDDMLNLGMVDEDTCDELVNEAAKFLTTVFREKREWCEELKRDREVNNGR